jgi:prepilin-type processing-associated H-X9-DG protein
MDAIRCPEIRTYETDGKKFDANSVKEAYGLVVASGNDGKFDFRGTRLFTTSAKEQIAPSALALGGCATSDGKSAAATINFASSGGGNATGIHHNDSANIFFFDGHSENVDKNSFAPGKFYPVQGNNASSTHAEAVSSSAWRNAVK